MHNFCTFLIFEYSKKISGITFDSLSGSATTMPKNELPLPPPSKWLSCEVSGEGPNDNPSYCWSFYELHDITNGNESTNGLDCCWTANNESTIPAPLANRVSVLNDGKMLVNQRKIK